MKKFKSVIAVVLAVIMATTIAPITASAKAVNTAQTAYNISMGSTPFTFRYGYAAGTYQSAVYETEVFYTFTAPTTDYYEFSATGYEYTQYSAGRTPYVSIIVKDANGQSVGSCGTNSITLETKKAFPLIAGHTYYIDLSDNMSSIASYSEAPGTTGFAQQTIYFNVSKHEHIYTTTYSNYTYGKYTYHNCNFCDYRITIYQNLQTGEVTTYTYSTLGNTTSVKASAPKKVSIKSLTKGKKCFTVKWSKPTYASGYQVQYATNKKMTSGKKTLTISSTSTTSKKVTGLKAKKTYYVRVRSYTVSNGKKSYSGWSAVKSVKTK